MENLRPGRNGGMIKNGGANKGAGRPRKLVTELIDELKAQGVKQVKPQNITDAFEVLINLTQDDLKEIALNTENSMLLRIVSKAMLSGKGFDVIEKMLDRAHGKAKTSVDHTTKGESINTEFSKIPLADRLAIMEILERAQQSKDEPGE